jgi:ATP-dependent RNA helicase DeaD
LEPFERYSVTDTGRKSGFRVDCYGADRVRLPTGYQDAGIEQQKEKTMPEKKPRNSNFPPADGKRRATTPGARPKTVLKKTTKFNPKKVNHPAENRPNEEPIREVRETEKPVAANAKETRPKKNAPEKDKPKPPAEAKAAPIVEPEPEPIPIAFTDLGLSEAVLKGVTDAGFESPTPIQAQAIPVLLTGKDLIGQAQTGTGKTAAFALPLIEKVKPEERHVQALVMVPTRELAVQAAGQIHLLSKGLGLRVVPVYGGQPIDRQFRALAGGAQIVVGTPGRVLDHLRRGSLNLSQAEFCALDEADEMLAFGFIEDIEAILAELPAERQLALFSATMPPRIAALTKKFMPDAETVAIRAKRRTVETVEQTYYEVAPGKKQEALARVLDMETPGPTIVFCRTRAETDTLAEALRLRGYGADALHGDMAQAERDRVMRRFREGQSDLLIATDVAARGLDIDTVTHVINYDMPWDVEQYIHRIGRTGRAGRAGDAITLIEPRERRNLRLIEQSTGAKITPARIPTVADISARRREVFRETLRVRLEKGDADGHLSTVETLSAEYDPAEIAAVALQMLWEQTHGKNSSADEPEEELAAEAGQPEQGMTKLFVPLGRQDGLRPTDLVGAISNEVGIPAKSIGSIDILDRTAFVEVPSADAEAVVAAFSRTKLRGRRIRVDFARPMRGRERERP